MIALLNILAKAEGFKTIKTGCVGPIANENDRISFTNKVGSTLQVDAALLYLGLVHLANVRQMTVQDYINKMGKRIEGE